MRIVKLFYFCNLQAMDVQRKYKDKVNAADLLPGRNLTRANNF